MALKELMDNLAYIFAKREEDEKEKADKVMTNWSKSDSQIAMKDINDDVPFDKGKNTELLYTITDVPPWYICIILGFQHFLMTISGVLSVPLLLAPYLCTSDGVVIGQILNTGIFVNGVVTLIQVAVGARLPVVQGGSTSFLLAAFSILSLPKWKCSVANEALNITESSTVSNDINNDEDDEWRYRMREIQGAIIISSIIEIAIGFTGLIGIFLKFIGPLVIAPIIALIGISLFKAAAFYCSANWWIALLTVVLITMFSQYLSNIKLPCCSYSRETRCRCRGYPIFKLFPVIISVIIAWIVCTILTASGALSTDPSHWTYKTRIDTRIDVLNRSPWFRFPYPTQWGMPTISAAGVLGMLSGVIVGMVESIGDYYACARLSDAPNPPVHAINRGIFMEGIGCVIAGFIGTGSGSTSYSQNIAAIGITKVGSTRVVIYSAFIMIILGTFGKFGALFVTIPDPIIGGLFVCLFGMITAVGISNLQFSDLNSSRNLYIVGLAIFVGISIPEWVKGNTDKVDTGNETVNQIFQVMLTTNMFVGGIIAFILDNTIPGTAKSRGIDSWVKLPDTLAAPKELECYDLPLVMRWIRKWTWTKYLPICPTFTSFRWRNASDKTGHYQEDNNISVTSLEKPEPSVNLSHSNMQSFDSHL